MAYEDHEHEVIETRDGHGKAMFAGVLLGGLTGALTALLFAPQSGKQTRIQIRETVDGARARAGETVQGAVQDVRARTGRIKVGVESKARELREQGKEVLAEQLDRVAAAAQAGKKNLRGEN